MILGWQHLGLRGRWIEELLQEEQERRKVECELMANRTILAMH